MAPQDLPMDSRRKSEAMALLRQGVPTDPRAQTTIEHIHPQDAQDVLDVAWERLDDRAPSVHRGLDLTAQTALLRRLCLKLAVRHDRLPSSFYVSGVICMSKEPIDSGAFADIYHGEYRGMVVILKRPRIPSEENRPKVMTEFCRESLLWSKLHHKNVLQFMGISRDSFQHSICMVLPLMKNGSIRRRMLSKEPGKELTYANFELKINNWIYEIAQGLAYLHSQGVVHGDLHGGNILIDDDDCVRLTDFGFALIAAATPNAYGSKHGGSSHHFMAPELWEPAEFDMEYPRPTKESDVYAFGCTAVELYTGKLPYPDPKMTMYRVSKKVLRGERPGQPVTPFGYRMPDELWHVLERSWSHVPSNRATAAQLEVALAAFK